MLWKSTITLNITGTNKPVNEFLVNYGVTDALAPLPLHHLVNTMTATINNNTVSKNVQESLPILMRLLYPQELATYNGMTPTTLDFLGNYSDAIDGCFLSLINNRMLIIKQSSSCCIYAWSYRNTGCGQFVCGQLAQDRSPHTQAMFYHTI